LDNLTHTLTGVMLARAGLARLSPRGTLIVVLAANAPDVDVISWFGGALTYLHYHRWLTHALIGLPVVAALPVLIARIFARDPLPWGRAFLISFIGVASHLLLDWTNVYGIRLFAPFSETWLRLDMTSVVDFWIWAVLLLAVAAPALARLVSSEMGAKTSAGRGWAIFALAVLSIYEFGRYLAHDRALALMDARVYNGEAPRRIAAFPSPANPLRWQGLVDLSNAYVLLPVDLLSEFDPTAGREYYKSHAGAAIEAARRTQPFRIFLDFSAFPLWRVTPWAEPEGASRVEALDLRFGVPEEPGFNAVAIVTATGEVINSAFGFGRLRPK
jgi:inner membrane protein